MKTQNTFSILAFYTVVFIGLLLGFKSCDRKLDLEQMRIERCGSRTGTDTQK